MSIGLTHTEEKKSDSNAKHANNERGHSMPGRIAGRSSKLSALFAGVEASVPAGAGDLDIRQVVCDSRKVQRVRYFSRCMAPRPTETPSFAMPCRAGQWPLPAKTRRRQRCRPAWRGFA